MTILRSIGAWLGVAVVITGVYIGASMLGTFGSVATAPGRVVQRTMETTNIIASYERFHDLWKGYGARLSQIKETAAYLAAETDPAEKVRLRIDLSAQRQSCREIASKYNADAAKTNKAIFQGRDAPETLSMEACS